MEDDIEPWVENFKTLLTQIDNMLADDHDEWEDYLHAARSAVATLDRIHFFRMTDRLEEQRWIIQVLQDYAYHDADEGSIQDIADWCRASWLRILRDHPEDVDILKGQYYSLMIHLHFKFHASFSFDHLLMFVL